MSFFQGKDVGILKASQKQKRHQNQFGWEKHVKHEKEKVVSSFCFTLQQIKKTKPKTQKSL